MTEFDKKHHSLPFSFKYSISDFISDIIFSDVEVFGLIKGTMDEISVPPGVYKSVMQYDNGNMRFYNDDKIVATYFNDTWGLK